MGSPLLISTQPFNFPNDLLLSPDSAPTSPSSAPVSPSSPLNYLGLSVTVLNEKNVVSQFSPMLSFSPTPPCDGEYGLTAVIEGEEILGSSELNADLITVVPSVSTAFSALASEPTSSDVASSSVRSSSSSPSPRRERAKLKEQSRANEKEKTGRKQVQARQGRQKKQRCVTQLGKRTQVVEPKAKENALSTIIIKKEEALVQSESTVDLTALAQPVIASAVASIPVSPAALSSSASSSSAPTPKKCQSKKEKTAGEMRERNNASAKLYRKKQREYYAQMEQRIEKLQKQNKKLNEENQALRTLNEVLLNRNTTLETQIEHCKTAAFVVVSGV